MAVADQNSGEYSRVLGNTEQNWCRAVTSGTGVTVLALMMARPVSEASQSQFKKTLALLQESHPLLRSKLQYDGAGKTFTFIKSNAYPLSEVTVHDAEETLRVLESNKSPEISTLQKILEHEINNGKAWVDPDTFSCSGVDVAFVALYTVSDTHSVAVLRLHTSVCDRTTAVSLLLEMLDLDSVAEEGAPPMEIKNSGEAEAALESLIPCSLTKKNIWAHGRDLIGYSLSSLRLTNMEFINWKSPRKSEVLRMQMDQEITSHIQKGCKNRGIKLCGVLSAAALLAVHSTKKGKKKYGVVTLIDSRSYLQPPLSPHHFGFYHSAILNVHTVKGTETLWELASNCYSNFSRFKTSNKHITDMADLNFLMARAIENPSLTPSSSLRSSLVSVFEDTVIDNSGDIRQRVGVEDYMGCASAHGIGPSIAIFDTVRDGKLDCMLVYPSPLHSREQMQEVAAKMTEMLGQGHGCGGS